MAAAKRRYSKEEFGRRGDALVESKVRPCLTAADEDKFVAIDIETGEYELDRNEIKAVERLRKRVADPQIWLVHVTLGHLHRLRACSPKLQALLDKSRRQIEETGGIPHDQFWRELEAENSEGARKEKPGKRRPGRGA